MTNQHYSVQFVHQTENASVKRTLFNLYFVHQPVRNNKPWFIEPFLLMTLVRRLDFTSNQLSFLLVNKN